MELGVEKGSKFGESHFLKESWISRSGAIHAEKCRDRSDRVENWSIHRIMLKIGRIDRIRLKIGRIDRIMLKIGRLDQFRLKIGRIDRMMWKLGWMVG